MAIGERQPGSSPDAVLAEIEKITESTLAHGGADA